MSATPDTSMEDLIPLLDECETVQEALELLIPDPDQSMRLGLAKMATALALIDEDHITMQLGPVQCTVSNIEDDDIDMDSPVVGEA